MSYIQTYQKYFIVICIICKQFTAKSPILSLVVSSLAGATTIRACKAEDMVMKTFHSRQDHQISAQFLTIAVAQALSFWIEFNSFLLLASVTYLCILLKNDTTDEGHVGLSLMQILNISVSISYIVKQVADSFSYMINVQRIMQFTKLEQEKLTEEEAALEISSLWPNKGEITMEHLYLRYSSDDNPVLYDINCVIEAGSKV